MTWLSSVILATWEAEIGRIMDSGQPRQKEKKTTTKKPVGHPFQCKKKWSWWCVPVIPTMVRSLK
jgi:hypothetical protein